MHDKSERESIIQYTNHLIEQNNDKIKKIKAQPTEGIGNDKQKKITDEIEELNYSNRMLALRLEEPILSMILEYRELSQKAREATTKEEKKHFSDLSQKKYQEILIEEFDGDKNIGRFNKF